MIRFSDRQVVVTREIGVRVIDMSATGCLVESRRSIEVGTIGTLRVRLGSEECYDDVEVVRCEAVEDSPTIYHVGVRLLRTKPRQPGSIRHAVAHRATSLAPSELARLM